MASGSLGEFDDSGANTPVEDAGSATAPRDDASADAAQRADTSAPDTGATVVPTDASAVDVAATCATGGANSGSRWQDLYLCLFGPTGKANCALTSDCHGAGGSFAGIWECGPSAAACWQGMVDGMLVTAGGMSDATQSTLYQVLRKPDGGGIGTMPLLPADLVFTTSDLARITAWIQDGGAANN